MTCPSFLWRQQLAHPDLRKSLSGSVDHGLSVGAYPDASLRNMPPKTMIPNKMK